MDTFVNGLDKLRKFALIAAGTLAIAVLLSCLVFTINSVKNIPSPPVFTDTLDSGIQEKQEKLLTNYKALSEEIQNQRTRIFDKVITDTIMPAFTTLITAIIGFVFAQGVGEALKSYFERKPSR